MPGQPSHCFVKEQGLWTGIGAKPSTIPWFVPQLGDLGERTRNLEVSILRYLYI